MVDDTDSDAAAAHELGVDAAAVARLGQGGAVTARHSRSGRGPASDDRRLELELCAGAAEVVAAGAGLERRASVASLRLRSRCVGDGEWRATWLSLTAEKGERAELRLPPRAGGGPRLELVLPPTRWRPPPGFGAALVRLKAAVAATTAAAVPSPAPSPPPSPPPEPSDAPPPPPLARARR